MKAQNKSMALFGIAFGLLLALSVQAVPLVSNVVGAQRPGTKLVDITYDLTDADHATLSVTIRISEDAGATWDVPCTSLTGNGIGTEVTPGKGKSIVWDAGADWNGQWSDQMLVEVTATIGGGGGDGGDDGDDDDGDDDDDPPPQIRGEYLFVDLSEGPDATSYPVFDLDDVGFPYSQFFDWHDDFKTRLLVLRKIPAGTFMMGSPQAELGREMQWWDWDSERQHQVVLTKDFYVGVFEVTREQWELVMGIRPDDPYAPPDFPMEGVSYDDIRGSDLGSGWPANNAVDADSFLGRLRAKTGLDFDLPTEAQWEYACRAGTTTALNSGKNLIDDGICPNMDEVGLYRNNGGDFGEFPDTVGSYRPNAWGLYDMHGDVSEWCLDWFDIVDYPEDPGYDLPEPRPWLEPVMDPKGGDGVLPAPGFSVPCRVIRGGYRTGFAGECRSAWRIAFPPSDGDFPIGFRVALIAGDGNPFAPFANNDAYAAEVDTERFVPAPGVLANDTDLWGERDHLTAILVDHTTHGTLALNNDGSFAYKPDPGFYGVDAFSYRATDGFDNYSTLAMVTITVDELEKVSEYLVVDLSAGPDATSYPVSFHVAAPAEGWTDAGWTEEYKSTKLVLRKIPAGSFFMGSPDGERGRDGDEIQLQVTLTKDFYVGVFEVTQMQWYLVTGARPSWFCDSDSSNVRPVEQVSYDHIRGSEAGSGWPRSNAVDGASFLGLLRAKTGLDFDLPTEAQWEYACRAGTETALNSGKNLSDEEECRNMAEVGRHRQIDTAIVGSYQPNRWGLYDMHGNVHEWCLDWPDYFLWKAAVDPTGDYGGTHRLARGGCYSNDAHVCRSAYRFAMFLPSAANRDLGFRIVMTVQ